MVESPLPDVLAATVVSGACGPWLSASGPGLTYVKRKRKHAKAMKCSLLPLQSPLRNFKNSYISAISGGPSPTLVALQSLSSGALRFMVANDTKTWPLYWSSLPLEGLTCLEVLQKPPEPAPAKERKRWAVRSGQLMDALVQGRSRQIAHGEIC